MNAIEALAATRLLAGRHRSDCQDRERIEQVRNGPRTSWDAEPAFVIRCVSCGCSLALLPRPEPLTPGSAEWVRAWQDQSSRITDALRPDELDDPKLNPRHPAATSWPPGREPQPPTAWGYL